MEKKPTTRKVPADSVPYGDSITRNGRTVWAAYDGETLVAVAATADEVRGLYYRAWSRWWRARLEARRAGMVGAHPPKMMN